jgi:hypothetical protein
LTPLKRNTFGREQERYPVLDHQEAQPVHDSPSLPDSTTSTRSVSLRLGGYGFRATEGTGVRLSIGPDALEFDLGPVFGRVSRVVTVESPIRVSRPEVVSIRRVWTGAYRMEHRASAPTPLVFGTAADNARLEADLRAAGYQVDAPAFTPRTRAIVWTAVLVFDVAVFVGVVAAGGGWLFVGVPLAFFGTIAAVLWLK